MKRYGTGSGHSKIQHRLSSNEVMGHAEMDSEYARQQSGHDHAPMKPHELDQRDPHVPPKHNAKAPNPNADLARREAENYPGQQEQE